jgi:hypothetical protein
MSATREQIMTALLALVTGAYQFKNDLDKARRLVLWTKVDTNQRPAIYQFEGDPEDWKWTNKAIPIITISVRLFIYTDAKDENVIGATQLNNILDALKAAFTPTGRDLAQGKFTLGGLVESCRIKGKVFKDPGDIDGDGLLIVPIEIELPF